MQDHWVKISLNGEQCGEPWVGKLTLPEDRHEQWRFELIRNTDPGGNPFAIELPFEGKSTLCGLINFQTPCTLVYPLATTVDPGSIGVYHTHSRQRTEGIFQALVSQSAIADIDEPKFCGFRFSSDSFLAWFGRRGFDSSLVEGSHMRQTTALPQENVTFQIAGFGSVTCRSGSLGHTSTWEDSFKSAASISIEFEEIQSLKDSMQWCWKFETLFQFLTGINTKWPDFTLVHEQTYILGEDERNCESELIFGRTPYSQSERSHPFECGHNSDRGGADLGSILANFFKSESIFERIQVINYTRFAKRSIADDFAMVVPVLEKYLRGTHVGLTEQNFLDHQEAFFKYIERSDDLHIHEFAKKHVAIKDTKAPSLKTILWRSAESLNASGFSISRNLTDRIANRRANLFHRGVGGGDEKDAKRMWTEAEGAAALLSLNTYRDLGIDISALEPGRTGNCEIAHFFARDAN